MSDLRRTIVTIAKQLGVEPLAEGEYRQDDFILSYTEPNEEPANPVRSEAQTTRPPTFTRYANAIPPTPVRPEPQPVAVVDPDGMLQPYEAVTHEHTWSGSNLRIITHKTTAYSVGEILHALLDRIDCVNSVRNENTDRRRA